MNNSTESWSRTIEDLRTLWSFYWSASDATSRAKIKATIRGITGAITTREAEIRNLKSELARAKKK